MAFSAENKKAKRTQDWTTSGSPRQPAAPQIDDKEEIRLLSIIIGKSVDLCDRIPQLESASVLLKPPSGDALKSSLDSLLDFIRALCSIFDLQIPVPAKKNGNKTTAFEDAKEALTRFSYLCEVPRTRPSTLSIALAQLVRLFEKNAQDLIEKLNEKYAMLAIVEEDDDDEDLMELAIVAIVEDDDDSGELSALPFHPLALIAIVEDEDEDYNDEEEEASQEDADKGKDEYDDEDYSDYSDDRLTVLPPPASGYPISHRTLPGRSIRVTSMPHLANIQNASKQSLVAVDVIMIE